MRKLAMVMAVAFCSGTAGLLWADAAGGSNNVNPQPLPPGAKQQVSSHGSGKNQDGDGINPTDTHEGGGKDTGDGEDALNPQPYPPKGKGTMNGKIEHERKAGGTQSKANFTGGVRSVNGDGKSLSGNSKSINGTGKGGKLYKKGANLKGATKGGTMDTFQRKAGITDGSSKDPGLKQYPGGPAGPSGANNLPAVR